MIENSDRIKVMINEYNAMKDLRELEIHQLDNRVELYFKMISVAIAAISAASFLVVNLFNTNKDIYMLLSSIVALVTWILLYSSYTSFLEIVDGHISIVEYTRGMNRVRRFFYDQDEDIRQYLSMPIADDKPAFGTSELTGLKTVWYGKITLVIVLSSSYFLLCEMNILYLLYKMFKVQHGVMIFFAVIAALALVVYYYWLLHCIYNKRIEIARMKSFIRFPTEK